MTTEKRHPNTWARIATWFSAIVLGHCHGSFWQFQRMVKQVTGRSAFFSYYGYGCYCGLGGRGTPVDNTDNQSPASPSQYEKLKQGGCQPMLNSYHFYVTNGSVLCKCAFSSNTGCLCGLRACECDKQSVYCFRENLLTYKRSFTQFSRRPYCGSKRFQC
ncbi:putative inactive group IIC secretory phospholipase A2 [Suncus etruscus]|uniref:putative inactive group IIC secretory phospholipase A2 n=1 Tax=Suncus etruscus TaxID=109475 RepID=UPI00210FC6B1|nr:putative inactive group IIC secretory phospholipase A2 [Suncus etruscus]